MRRHILPNIAPVVIVQLSLVAALPILAEAALSLSRAHRAVPALVGPDPQQPAEHRHRAPVAGVLPGLALVLATLGFNLLGDGLRDAATRLRGTASPTRAWRPGAAGQ